MLPEYRGLAFEVGSVGVQSCLAFAVFLEWSITNKRNMMDVGRACSLPLHPECGGLSTMALN